MQKKQCQEWDLNPRLHSETRTPVPIAQWEGMLSPWVWRLRPLGHPDIGSCALVYSILICFFLLLFHLSFTHRLFIGESAFINSLTVRFVRLWTHAYLFFLDTLNFPFKLIKIVISTSFSKFRQILIELCRQKTSNIWGKMHFQFCYLPTAYYYRLDSL